MQQLPKFIQPEGPSQLSNPATNCPSLDVPFRVGKPEHLDTVPGPRHTGLDFTAQPQTVTRMQGTHRIGRAKVREKGHHPLACPRVFL